MHMVALCVLFALSAQPVAIITVINASRALRARVRIVEIKTIWPLSAAVGVKKNMRTHKKTRQRTNKKNTLHVHLYNAFYPYE